MLPCWTWTRRDSIEARTSSTRTQTTSTKVRDGPFIDQFVFSADGFSSEAEKSGHQAKQQELSERVQKVSIDLDRVTADYTTTFTELNELKKKLSSTQNEQMVSQRRMTDLVSVAPRDVLQSTLVFLCSDQTTRGANVRERKRLSDTFNPTWRRQSKHIQRTEKSCQSTTTNDCQVGHICSAARLR